MKLVLIVENLFSPTIRHLKLKQSEKLLFMFTGLVMRKIRGAINDEESCY